MIHDDSKNHINFSAKALFVASFLAAAGLSAGNALAASEEVLWSFCAVANCADGTSPVAGVVADSKGNLYGTASLAGGPGNHGVLFSVSASKSFKVLHTFGGSDGCTPDAPLLSAGGSFFGVTEFGGTFNQGVVFIRSATGFTVAHSFTGTDGSEPYASLVADASSGNIYGTAESGGTHSSGTIFKIAPGGSITTLYSFCSKTGCTDGSFPFAGLSFVGGNLYGTTDQGGTSGLGVVFKIGTDGSNYTVLHSFMGGPIDGRNPEAGLSADSTFLYGTTAGGGTNYRGTVFKIAPDGSNYAVLYSFCNLASCADGSSPLAGVIVDADRNLYGTTEAGGANNHGAVFSVTPTTGNERVVYSFCNQTNGSGYCLDGSTPQSGLAFDRSGNLYGTTNIGGAKNDGTVFKLTNTGFVP